MLFLVTLKSYLDNLFENRAYTPTLLAKHNKSFNSFIIGYYDT